MFHLDQIVRVTDAVSVSHTNRIRQSGIISAICGDLFDNGQQWYEVTFADGGVIHLMGKELEDRSDVFQLHVIRYDNPDDVSPLDRHPYSTGDSLYTVILTAPHPRVRRDTFTI